MAVWAAEDAETRFDELVELALSDGPQTIIKDGVEYVVLISVEEYRALKNPNLEDG